MKPTEEQACCACLHVDYDPIRNVDGSFTEKWWCRNCFAEFIRKRVSNPKPTEGQREAAGALRRKHGLHYHATDAIAGLLASREAQARREGAREFLGGLQVFQPKGSPPPVAGRMLARWIISEQIRKAAEEGARRMRACALPGILTLEKSSTLATVKFSKTDAEIGSEVAEEVVNGS
jgi:hypothetical protein